MENPKFKSVAYEIDFYNTLRKRVKRNLAGKQLKYGGVSFWLKGLYWLLATYISYTLLFQTDNALLF